MAGDGKGASSETQTQEYSKLQTTPDEVLKFQAKKKKVEEKFTYYEIVWRGIFIVLVIIGVVLTKSVYNFHNSPIVSDIPKNSIYDFWISIVVALLVVPVKAMIKRQFFDKIMPLLSEKRSADINEKHKRCETHCKWIFDVVYYSLATITGYWIIHDQPFLPPALLGHGECQNLVSPFPKVPDIPYLKLYYLVQGGVHLYALMHQFTSKRGDGKFYEYTLHHSIAVFLIWFSYMMNYLQIGVVILLIHDPSDVLLIATRAYTDMKKKILSINIILFLLSYTFWIYVRNYVLPSCVLRTCFNAFWNFYGEPLFDIILLPNIFMLSMLIILSIMHVYWTLFFTKAIVSMITKGKDKNGYDS